MEAALARSYRLEFAKRAEWRREDERRTLDQIRQKEQKDREKEREHEAEQQAFLDMATMALASQAEITAFTVELDAYDTATVEALMENEEQVRDVRQELKVLLDQAYVLPDGRRVFKTEDGTRVFDERGVEVKNIDPDVIEEWRPSWERYEDPFEREADLAKQREDILEFQKLTDEVRAEKNDAEGHGGMTRERLEELREKLADEAPDIVESKLAKDGPEQTAELSAAPNSDASYRPAGKLDMPAL